jgi:hypothetical protein
MPTKQFISTCKIACTLPFGASYLAAKYMHGLPMVDPEGRAYPVQMVKDIIREATSQVENFLFIKIVPQTVEEVQDFIEEEWRSWGFVKAHYNISSLIEVQGYIGVQKVLDLNIQNWTFKGRTIAFVPGATVLGNVVVGAGGNIILVRSGVRIIPNFWHLKYTTGIVTLPFDILNVIGKLAAIQMLAIMGDILLRIGVTNESLSIDGLSQSFGTTKSGTTGAYGARIQQYTNDLMQREIAQVKDAYRGITFEVV